MPTLNFHDRQHLQRMLVQEEGINVIFDWFIRAVSPELRKWKNVNNRNSVWIRNSTIENKINLYLIELIRLLEKYIKTNQESAWKSAIEKNDQFVEQYVKGMALTSVVRDGMFSRNLDALKALQNRIDNGMNLSVRIWTTGVQTKGHLELYLKSGLSVGRSAEGIGRDLRQLLRDPDKRFRRIRNEKGELIPSQPMKNYNPGRGIYRSSRMNAIRVAATETNIAYRMSDSERWKQLDFVLGFEVHRSPNAHPCVICDSLKGKYPKDFVFSGFHPFCICHAVPIVMNHDDFAGFLLGDKIPKNQYIQGLPAKAIQFLEKNPKYYERSYYGKMNQPFFKDKQLKLALE